MNLPRGWPGSQQTQADPQVTQQAASPPYAAAPQSAGSEDQYERIANAEDRERRNSNFPIPGAYPVLLVDFVKMIRTRKDEDFFVAEFEILQSKVVELPAGTRMVWMCNLKHDPSPRNIKEFICALMGVEKDAVTPEAVKYACGPDNPCHGRLVRLEASSTTTKAGNPFTVCDWYTLGDEVQAKWKELRTAAGFDVDIPF